MSKLTSEFLIRWKLTDGPSLQSEYRFDDMRRWRFDFAEPLSKVAIELEGGVFRKQSLRYMDSHNRLQQRLIAYPGRHNTGTGFANDCEKYLVAALKGWTIFRLTSNLITMDWIFMIASFVRLKQSHPAAEWQLTDSYPYVDMRSKPTKVGTITAADVLPLNELKNRKQNRT